MNVDLILTIVNVILAVVSGIGAYKSVKYYRKSHNLTIYAQTNKALIEIEKMLHKLPDALAACNLSNRNKKGFSITNTLCEIGKELMDSLNEIRSNVPQEYSTEVRKLEDDEQFHLQQYINSFISGEAVTENGIDSVAYNNCQTRLVYMQDYLKQVSASTEEKLK